MRLSVSFVRSLQKLINLNVQDSSKAVEDIDRRVRGTSFDVAEVRGSHTSVDSQYLLREPASSS